jgi:leucyl-tRNA synthetase
MRNSAKELIPNHLTFFAFHHAALFPEKLWPGGFSVNGMIQIEGKKMSKTKGNFVTWKAALDKYGADAFRLALALTADGMDDADWRDHGAEDAKAKVESLVPFVRKSLRSSVRREKDALDSWLFSSMNRRIGTVTRSLDEMRIRRASASAFLDTMNDIRWYLHRSDKPSREVLSDVFEAWAKITSPFTPFVAEELHHELGGKGLISQADWPSPKDFPIDEEAELGEVAIGRVIEDARNVLKVVKGPRSVLNVYVASDASLSYFSELISARRKGENVGAIVKKFAALRSPPDRVFKLAYELGDDLTTKFVSQRGFDEHAVLAGAEKFLSRELGVNVRVQKAEKEGTHDPAGRAKDALPMKPALYLE